LSQGLTLHFVVLSFDRYSRDDVIGEVMVELDSVDLSASDHQPVAMARDILPRSYKVNIQTVLAHCVGVAPGRSHACRKEHVVQLYIENLTFIML
jgi:hypothetical protein